MMNAGPPGGMWSHDHSAGPPTHPPPPQTGPPGGPSAAVPSPSQRNAQTVQQNPQARQARPQFNEEDLKTTAQYTFDRFDVDKGGYLDLQEFLDAMRALHYTLAYHDAIDRFHRADSNNNGRISKEEFVTMYVEEMRNKLSY